MLPVDADPPDEISWQVTDYPGRLYGDAVSLSWDTPGIKIMSVVATHCGGSTSTSHGINISEPPPVCPIPLIDVHLTGPTLIKSESTYEYQAAKVPYNATSPVTFTWEATGQPIYIDTGPSPSENTYAWDHPGYKTITVTAENCGGVMAAHMGVSVVDPDDLPDLVISNGWFDRSEGRVGYVIHNQGNSTAPGGFYVQLRKATSSLGVDKHPSPLRPGETDVGYVNTPWNCGSSLDDTGLAVLEADWGSDVMEGDETNNEWSDTWACDQRPPEIIEGPEVVDIGETRAGVRWRTDEDCQGWVEYGTSPYNQPYTQEGSSSYLTAHEVGLKELEPATTYFIRAFCEDEAGLVVNSDLVSFETAMEGTRPPEIRSMKFEPYPNQFYEFWQITIELENDAEMDRVSCEIDGTLIGSDYSADNSDKYPTYTIFLSPYDMGYSRDDFYAGHPFSCTAYRINTELQSTIEQYHFIDDGWLLPISMWINEPNPNHKIYIVGDSVPADTTLNVTVDASAFEWSCTQNGFSDIVPPGLNPVDCDDLTPMGVDSIQLWIADTFMEQVDPVGMERIHTLTGDIGGFAPGYHEIEVIAQKGSSFQVETQYLIVESGEPSLEAERSIRREENTIFVTLELHNDSTVPLYIRHVYDIVQGLQPIIKGDTSSLGVDYHVKIAESVAMPTWFGARQQKIKIEFVGGDLELLPGESVSVEYELVPVLLQSYRTPVINPYIEDLRVGVWDGVSKFEHYDFHLWGTMVYDPSYGMVPLEDAVANAIRETDYVIVTLPYRVYSLLAASPESDEGAEKLFSNMAELASLQNGVLGFPFYSHAGNLDDLIEPGSLWTDALNPVFDEKDKGYVLLVGEVEIVSSYYMGEDHFTTYIGIPDHVHESDLPYANTRGKTARPELVVGRVIGDNLNDMNSYLENIIATLKGEPGHEYYSRDKAYICNGNGDGEDWFADNAQYVDDQLDSLFNDSNYQNFIGDGGWDQWAYHRALMPDRDLIFYRGHGNIDQWDNGLYTSYLRGAGPDYELDFGDKHPIVFAAACTTGNYNGDDDLNLAETFLWKGAALYLGSTEKSERWSNSDAFVSFIPNWSTSESFGQAMNQVKRFIWDLDDAYDNRKLWAHEYNLYGDPKYGRIDAQTEFTDSQDENKNLSIIETPQGMKLKIGLPKLEFSNVDRNDLVRIPDGYLLSELGSYPVPVWSFFVDIKPGESVQDVQLYDRSDPIAYSELKLPVVEAATDCECLADQNTAKPPVEGWFPPLEQVLDWSVEKNHDGSSTLFIQLYPFNYYPGNGDALYYSSYILEVETFETTVQINSIDAPQDGNVPDEPVWVNLVIEAEGRPKNVIVQGRVQEWSTSEVLGGLPLKTLHDLSGIAVVDLLWDTRPYAAGDYMIVVDLFDTEGHLLDTAATEVRLGTYGAQLNLFSASQDYFTPDEEISIQMGVVNTGTATLSGTAVFQITEIGVVSPTQVFTAAITGLAPGKAARRGILWDTRGLEGDNYRVVGYFKFNSQITEPMEITLRRPRIFLPMITH